MREKSLSILSLTFGSMDKEGGSLELLRLCETVEVARRLSVDVLTMLPLFFLVSIGEDTDSAGCPRGTEVFSDAARVACTELFWSFPASDDDDGLFLLSCSSCSFFLLSCSSCSCLSRTIPLDAVSVADIVGVVVVSSLPSASFRLGLASRASRCLCCWSFSVSEYGNGVPPSRSCFLSATKTLAVGVDIEGFL